MLRSTKKSMRFLNPAFCSRQIIWEVVQVLPLLPSRAFLASELRKSCLAVLPFGDGAWLAVAELGLMARSVWLGNTTHLLRNALWDHVSGLEMEWIAAES